MRRVHTLKLSLPAKDTPMGLVRTFTSMTAVLALGFGAIAMARASGQSYPSKPIKIVVAFPVGTQPDIMARIAAQSMAPSLGLVIVENRPGAGGTIATKAAASAEPDGYTLLLGGTSNPLDQSRTLQESRLRSGHELRPGRDGGQDALRARRVA